MSNFSPFKYMVKHFIYSRVLKFKESLREACKSNVVHLLMPLFPNLVKWDNFGPFKHFRDILKFSNFIHFY